MASTTQILQRYAQALLQLASAEGQVDRVSGELDALAHNIAGNEELSMHLASPRMPDQSKKHLLEGVMGVSVTPLVRRTVCLLVDRGRAPIVVDLADVFRDAAMEAAGRMVAKVSTARPLTDDQRTTLVHELNQLTGKTITLEEATDASLLGGVKIILGSQMIDGSLRRRLETLGESLYRVPLSAD